MLKKIFAFMLAVILLVSFTACGKKVDSIPGAQEYHGEGEIQGGIKSDEELAKITEEADTWDGQEDKESTNEPSFEDNTGHEPESYGSGNPQDYWQSDSYFDLVGYLKANGAIDAYPSDSHYEKVTSDALFYTAYTSDYTWRLMIYNSEYSGSVIVSWLNHMQPPYDQDGPSYMVFPSDLSRQADYNVITIDDYGNTIPDYTIDTVIAIMQAIQSNPDSKDPFSNYTDVLNYIKCDL